MSSEHCCMNTAAESYHNTRNLSCLLITEMPIPVIYKFLLSQDLEELNTSLNVSMKNMSLTLGQLQAKEEELKTLIRHKVRGILGINQHILLALGQTSQTCINVLHVSVCFLPSSREKNKLICLTRSYNCFQDKELGSASSQIQEMIERLKTLDRQYKDIQLMEAEGKKDIVEWKDKYARSRKEVDNLKGL